MYTHTYTYVYTHTGRKRKRPKQKVTLSNTPPQYRRRHICDWRRAEFSVGSRQC